MVLKKLSALYSYLKSIEPEDRSESQKKILQELEQLHGHLQSMKIKRLATRILREDQDNRILLELIIVPPPNRCPACGRPW